jgi:hypothetical protein
MLQNNEILRKYSIEGLDEEVVQRNLHNNNYR